VIVEISISARYSKIWDWVIIYLFCFWIEKFYFPLFYSLMGYTSSHYT